MRVNIHYRLLQIGFYSVLMLQLWVVVAEAADVSLFKVTGYDGFLTFRYLAEEQATSIQGQETSKNYKPTFQEEYGVNAKSYVFHPNFINLELGGSVLLDQSRYVTLDKEESEEQELLNYYIHLDSLQKKPFPVSVYYDKQNPTTLNATGTISQEHIKYGFEMSLLEPFVPIRTTIGASKQTVTGEGFDQVYDDTTEQSNIRFHHSYGSGNYMQLSLQATNIESKSGNINLAIEPRMYSTTSTSLEARNLYGDSRQLQLNNTLSLRTQDQIPARDELRFSPNLRWVHSDTLNSYYQFEYNSVNEEYENNNLNEVVESNNRLLIAGVGHSVGRYNGRIDLHGANNQTTGLDYQNIGSNYSVGYTIPLNFGQLLLGYNGSLDYRDQISSVTELQVNGEEVVLEGIQRVTLNNLYIIDTSIRVWNLNRTQEFIRDIDFEVTRLGAEIQIARIAGGGILDGQSVLVDYRYETGGTFNYTNQVNLVKADLDISPFYKIFTTYRTISTDLREGTNDLPLNSGNSLNYGFSIDRPLLNGVVWGVNVTRTQQQEDVNPFDRKSYDAFIELPFKNLTNVRLSARQEKIDYHDDDNLPDEDVDLDGLIVRVQSRPWLRTTLSLESNFDKDVGGTVFRETRSHRFSFKWNLRQLSFMADARYSMITQGDTDFDRWALRVALQRNF